LPLHRVIKYKINLLYTNQFRTSLAALIDVMVSGGMAVVSGGAEGNLTCSGWIIDGILRSISRVADGEAARDEKPDPSL
jgi:hypothetical protein